MNALGPLPLVCLVTTGEACDPNFTEKKREIIEIVSTAIEAGVSIVQVREKMLSARRLSELVEAVVELSRGSQSKVLVNDRADIALGAGADGVHLAANSLPARVIRDNFPSSFIVGVSTHTIEEVRVAAADGADFAFFGPVFATPGKNDPQGLEMLASACDAVRPFPVIGIGGIDENNCEAVITAGASGIAAIRALNDRRLLDAILGRLRG